MHGMRMVVGRRAGESSRCEDPAPTVGIAERMLRGIASGLYKASANGRAQTARHAASLRPSGNGRIGFKPPYSKRETAAKSPVWAFFIGGLSHS